jgi:hypothetical protein
VHLLHVGGYSQYATTYWFDEPRIRSGYWTRRYSVVLPNPWTEDVVEFAFTFAFFGPFREYCRNTSEMDRIVRSLRWVRS